MKRPLTLLCTVLVLGTPLASFAQPGPPDRNEGGPSHQVRHDQGHGKDQGRGKDQGQPYRNPQFKPQPGMPVPHQEWRRGHVVDPHYRADRYWVTDWRARHLSAPPREHRWLYVNGDYVLVAIATGVIVNVLSGY
jgi:Ni/Co efflux regulator RcnB